MMTREPTLEILRSGIPCGTPAMQELSPRWNRCWAHATPPLPDMAPEGSIIVMTAPRP